MLSKKRFQNNINKFFWFYTLMVILLCILPINSSESSLNNIYIISIRLDYLVHLFLFSPWMFLWKYFTKHSFHKNVSKTILFISVGCMFAFGAELIQLYLPYRAFNINDLIANMTGIGVGSIFFFRQ